MAPLKRLMLDSPNGIDSKRESLLEVLGSLEVFSNISRVRLKRLIDGARVSRLSRHTENRMAALFAADIYILIQGVAKIAFIDGHDRPLVTTIIGPGAVFGGRSVLLPETIHGLLFVCLRDCVFARFDAEEFVGALLGTSLTQFAKLQEMTILRFCDQVLRYSGRAHFGLRERLALALLELAAKFGARDSRGMLLTLLVTHDMLADLVGASRQRITLLLNELIRCGAVKRDGRRLILVTDELERIGRITSNELPSPVSEADIKDRRAKGGDRNGVGSVTFRGPAERGSAK